MRRHIAVCVLILGVVMLLATVSGAGPSFQFTSIDFPGAVLTNAQGINPGGEIVGIYTDTAGKQHGFLLTGGKFTSIYYSRAISTNARRIVPRRTILASFT